jgi:hypothetical protein
MTYTVLILRRAQREMQRLPQEDYERVREAMRRLAQNPRPLAGRGGPTTGHRWAYGLAGIHPGQPFDRGGKRFGNDRVSKDESLPFPDEQRTKGPLQEYLPGPVGSQHSRQAVVGHGFQRLSQCHTTCRCAIIQKAVR